MKTHTTHRATAVGLAALITLATLGSLDQLAARPVSESLLAGHAAAVVAQTQAGQAQL
jgi:hypothetical protein